MSARRLATLAAVAFSFGLPVAARAQMDHSHHTMAPSATAPSATAPVPAGAAPSAAPFGAPVMDEHVFYHVLFSQLEGRFGDSNAFRWEGEAWIGTDYNRLLLRSEGQLSHGEVDDGQQELFYSRPISTYFNAQIGGRYDLDSLPGRGWGAIGIEGLAPQFFHVAATAYASGGGHFAAKLEGSYDLLITQRLILQPQIEMNFYTRDDPARMIGSGLSSIDAGLRLRYEITRKIAPYVGVTYEGLYGGTADYARAAGSPTDQVRFAAGARLWF